MLDNFDSIVHGVDVSGCKFAEPGYKTPKCSIEDNLHCDGFRNCYYKQYKRTEKAWELDHNNGQTEINRLYNEVRKKDEIIRLLTEEKLKLEKELGK